MIIEDDTLDVWVYDLARETLSRVTSESNNYAPVWTPDGRRLTFAKGNLALNGRNAPNIYWKSLATGGAEERLLASEQANWPFSWSSDGRVLAFMAFDAAHQFSTDFTGVDVWWISLDDVRKPRPFLQSRFNEAAPVFSPDGHWLAYVSDESGRNEIYVQPFPGPGEKWQISTDGGTEPMWPRAAHELFYRSGDAMMAVDVKTDRTFSAGQPRRLFTSDHVKSPELYPNYDVSSDGRRFIMLRMADAGTRSTQINVVVNWVEALQRRVPARTK